MTNTYLFHRVLIGTAILLGSAFSGANARAADDAPPDERFRRNLVMELGDVGRALGRLNQSYVIPPIISSSAATGGSFFIDTVDEGESSEGDTAAGGKAAKSGGKVVRIKLPSPLFVGSRCARLPCWLQGEIGWLYGEVDRPVCVDIPKPCLVVPYPTCGCRGRCHHHARRTYPDANATSDAVPLSPETTPAGEDAMPQAPMPEAESEPVPALPSAIKQPSSASEEIELLREELKLMREEIEKLRQQLNRDRKASVRDTKAE